jgi:acetate kinase
MMPLILTLNGGSSSIRFALYEMGASLKRVLSGKIDRIDQVGATLSFRHDQEESEEKVKVSAVDHKAAAHCLMDWFSKRTDYSSIKAIGHRVVHGMKHTEPELVNEALLHELRTLSAYDPEHLPGEIELIEVCRERHPELLQVTCFDTAFHTTMPDVAKRIAIPRRYRSIGVQRYGFHGLSYSYLIKELKELGDPAASNGRVILAHLGNGASMTAVRDGQSIDTSMGFTPTSGLIMSTRSGDIDPGLMSYLARIESMGVSQFQQMVNHESGLLGISETSSDMRDLMVHEASDTRAAEAVESFCYQAKKGIGSYAAVLGGVDTIVFAGGIGENCPSVRSRICADLEFLGVELDETQNTANESMISTLASRVSVRVIRTDEELMIAQSVSRFLSLEEREN